MRKESTIRNGVWATLSYAIIFILALVSRQAFLRNFDDALLGYYGVISNIFSLLSVAELGVGTVISYGLYPQLQKKDQAEIATLLMIYKWIYRIIGLLIFIGGVICYFCLPLIIVDANANWTDIHLIYAIELINAVAIYFMSFRRLLFVADQQEYRCIKIESVVQILAYIVRIYLAYCTNMYILYLGMGLITNIIANSLICLIANRHYPYARYKKITLADIRKRGIFRDMTSYGVQRLSIAVWGGLDNIIAMRFIGAQSVVMMTNYTSVESGVTSFVNKMLGGFQPSIGDYVSDQSRPDKTTVFDGLNLVSFMIAAFVAVSYSALFQPFIQLWYGQQYLLPFSYVICFAINQYIGWNHRMLGYFRSAVGRFKQDQNYMVISAVSNLLLSLILVVKFGITGILAATCVGHMFQWLGRSRVVYTNILEPSRQKDYWLKQAVLALLAVLETMLTIWICGFLPAGIIGLVARGAVCVVLPNAINLAVLWKRPEFFYVRTTINNAVNSRKKGG